MITHPETQPALNRFTFQLLVGLSALVHLPLWLLVGWYRLGGGQEPEQRAMDADIWLGNTVEMLIHLLGIAALVLPFLTLLLTLGMVWDARGWRPRRMVLGKGGALVGVQLIALVLYLTFWADGVR